MQNHADVSRDEVGGRKKKVEADAYENMPARCDAVGVVIDQGENKKGQDARKSALPRDAMTAMPRLRRRSSEPGDPRI